MAKEMNVKVARGFKTGTVMNTIDVPPELRVRRSTGLLPAGSKKERWFDAMMGGLGGLVPTTCGMLTGMPGAGKSTLMRQLADSMDIEGHYVVYVSLEESLYQAKMACERLKLKNNFHVSEECMLPKLLEFMVNAKKDPKNAGKQQVLLIDSIQALDDGKYVDAQGRSRGTTGNTPVHCAEMLVDWCQETFGIAWFIGQVTKSGDFAGKQAINHAIDARVHLYYDDKEKSDTYGCLLAEVPKNRWGCNGMTLVLGMTGTGIEERGHIMKPGFSNGAAKEADA